MSPTRVGVIGAGIAGPVLASLLKLEGYEPIVFERNSGPSEAGIGIGLQVNGLLVLAKIPGLLDCLPRYHFDELHYYSVIPEDTGVIGVMRQPGQMRKERSDGLGTFCIRRSTLQKKTVEFVEKLGVEFRWDHKLETLEQDENGVTVAFTNGVKDTFSFVVGCDGLHSITRRCLFGEQPADYTGLSQFGGYAPAPERLKGKAIAMNLFGDGVHMIATPLDETMMAIAVTQREPEAKETWKAMDPAGVEEFKKSPISEWPFDGAELLKTSYNITKYGLYDRPELKTWHKGRVLLIGDAAHPTSPHLGQGANQSFEDAGLLVELLQRLNPSREEMSAVTLETVFSELEKIRIPRSSEMVKRARAQGETRVVHGTEACIKRNNMYREMCGDDKLMRARFSAAQVAPNPS